MLAVKRLAEMQRSSEGRGSPRKKPPPITQQQEVMSVDGPPPDGKLTDENLIIINSSCPFKTNLYLYNLYINLLFSLFRDHVSKDEHLPGQRVEQ